MKVVIGAIYRDKGFSEAFAWIERTFEDLLSKAFSEHDFEKDYKTRLQEHIQESHKVTPKYRVIDQLGPDHDRIYKMEVSVAGEVWGVGEGSSKKAAAQDAARVAFERLDS